LTSPSHQAAPTSPSRQQLHAGPRVLLLRCCWCLGRWQVLARTNCRRDRVLGGCACALLLLRKFVFAAGAAIRVRSAASVAALGCDDVSLFGAVDGTTAGAPDRRDASAGAQFFLLAAEGPAERRRGKSLALLRRPWVARNSLSIRTHSADDTASTSRSRPRL
jgi:hypothetical protein